MFMIAFFVVNVDFCDVFSTLVVLPVFNCHRTSGVIVVGLSVIIHMVSSAIVLFVPSTVVTLFVVVQIPVLKSAISAVLLQEDVALSVIIVFSVDGFVSVVVDAIVSMSVEAKLSVVIVLSVSVRMSVVVGVCVLPFISSFVVVLAIHSIICCRTT